MSLKLGILRLTVASVRAIGTVRGGLTADHGQEGQRRFLQLGPRGEVAIGSPRLCPRLRSRGWAAAPRRCSKASFMQDGIGDTRWLDYPHLALLPTSVIVMCPMVVSTLAPCQWRSPALMCATSPTLISRCSCSVATMPAPEVTIRI